MVSTPNTFVYMYSHWASLTHTFQPHPHDMQKHFRNAIHSQYAVVALNSWIPVCCPLSPEGNKGILSEQRAGVDLSIGGKELGQLVVSCIQRQIPHKQLHVLTAHLCVNRASAERVTVVSLILNADVNLDRKLAFWRNLEGLIRVDFIQVKRSCQMGLLCRLFLK